MQLDGMLMHPEPPRLGVLHRRRAGGRRDQEVNLAGRDRHPLPGLVLGHAPHLRTLSTIRPCAQAWQAAAADGPNRVPSVQ
jgi:hypothetical protein